MLMTLLLPVVLIVVFYFMLIRPESKRKKAAAKMRDELIVGDEITTIGGIVGKVVQIKDDTITLETGAEKSRVKLMRWAISSKGEQVSDK
ncbi:MAG: preprotein translocase subunit YajC [Oscillospiraceae bacterium]|nr:preprotein translocase subunit YajC [Oscillospiraceae bacterium]